MPLELALAAKRDANGSGIAQAGNPTFCKKTIKQERGQTAGEMWLLFAPVETRPRERRAAPQQLSRTAQIGEPFAALPGQDVRFGVARFEILQRQQGIVKKDAGNPGKVVVACARGAQAA